MQVVNKRGHRPTPKGVYIGRPSPLGNPFSHLPGTLAQYQVATRDDAVSNYERWLVLKIKARDPQVLAALRRIKDDSILVCWCKPASCHGDIIMKLWYHPKVHKILFP